MKITIDTKEDSHEEIRNIIKMLSSLVGEGEVVSNKDIFSDDSGSEEYGGDQAQDVFNIFNDSSSSKSESSSESDSEESDKDEKEDDDLDLGIPRLKEYD